MFMPFGADLLAGGGAEFRLWAPHAKSVSLVMESGPEQSPVAMERSDGCWFTVRSTEAQAGSRYRFLIDGRILVPDPASRYQPEGVFGPSEVVDPEAFDWSDEEWKGRPWEEAVVYELHVGAFSPDGDFGGVAKKLDYLQRIGITAIELMPVGAFAGRRNWGYDGVLPFAPHSGYGGPDDLKRLVEQAHLREMMVFLDVVYNHMGPEGNHLPIYASQFFAAARKTPWGAALNFDGDSSGPVREYFIQNALYWLMEYHVDGLRLDAVDAMLDDSQPHILEEIARRCREEAGGGRELHLILENDDNSAGYLERGANGKPALYTAQWNDDIGRVAHVIATDETGGYFGDHSDDAMDRLGRCLTQGFDYQGDRSAHRKGKIRGEPCGHLSLVSFVSFLQTHDLVGNRPYAERLISLASEETVKALTAIIMLSPQPPLVFMGQEFASSRPFPFFCDFSGDLGREVVKGRTELFKEQFGPETVNAAFDPNAAETFAAAVLDWSEAQGGKGERWLGFFRRLTEIRKDGITPLFSQARGEEASYEVYDGAALTAKWRGPGGHELLLCANLSDGEIKVEPFRAGRMVYESSAGDAKKVATGNTPPWSVVWRVNRGSPRH